MVTFYINCICYLVNLSDKLNYAATRHMEIPVQTRSLNRFQANDIISLTEEKVRYDLAESVGPDLALTEVMSAEDYQSLQDLKLEYGTAAGAVQLRTAIAEQHDVHADDVVVTVGGMHAIFLLGLILCNESDHVVVSEPVFPLAASAVAFTGATVGVAACRFDDGYRPDAATLANYLKPNTRLVCLASPQNPSGVAISHATIMQLLNAMREICPDAYLLIDETYRIATYGNEPPVASLVHIDPRIVSCSSLSKCHGAPGLRIGWAISRDRALIEQLILGKFQSVIACSAIDEALALQVLQNSEVVLAKRQRHLAAGLECVKQWVARNTALISLVTPDAGALCCLRLNLQKFDLAAVDAFHKTLATHSVRVAPGSWFGDEPHVFRLGFGLLPIAELQHALEIMSHVLDNTHQQEQSI